MAVGGAQNLLLSQADWFHAQGYPVTAAFLYDRDGLSAEWQAQHAFPLVDLRMRNPSGGWVTNAGHFLSGLISLWKSIRQGRFSVVVSYTHHANLVAMPLAWMGRVPVRIATHHGEVERVPNWQRKFHSWILNCGVARLVVAVSQRVRENAIRDGVNPKKIRIILNGIAIKKPATKEVAKLMQELNLDRDAVVLLSIGRLVYQKAHNVLIAALPRVLEIWPNLVLFIAGDGPLHSELVEQINNLKLTDKVYLLGVRKDIPALLSISQIFVLPSRWEGLPIALLEAMGAGLPIVATRVEGVEDVVDVEAHGILVPVEDTNALADALIQLVRAPEVRQRMGMAARKHVEKNYTIDRVCESYLNLFQEFLRIE